MPGFGLQRYTFDLLMHILLHAKERSPTVFGGLLANAGFRLVKVHPTRGFLQVVEAVPI